MERKGTNSRILSDVLEGKEDEMVGLDGTSMDPTEEKRVLQDVADDAKTRLSVAMQQMAEHAEQRAEDIRCLYEWMNEEGQTKSKDVVWEEIGKRIQNMVEEASGFAVQCRADAKSSSTEKRTWKENGKHGDQKGNGEMLVDASDGLEDVSMFPAEADASDGLRETPEAEGGFQACGNGIRERCKYIPLRLTLRERKMLRLLEAALSVSEYTDKVDIFSYRSRMGRIHAQIKELCAILSGLVVASDYKAGQELIMDKEFSNNASFFQDVFEVGRRHKIMNPEKMRNDYGKLVYLLQDSMATELQELLQFKCVKPLQTVHTLLEEKNGLALLDDPLVEIATCEVKPEGKTRAQVEKEIKTKEAAREKLARTYGKGKLTGDEVKHCLYSIGDNNSYLLFNRDPIDKMIAYLTRYFDPHQVEEPKYSLGIVGGKEGSRLTHNHSRQYTYVLQSLTLWREISHDMFKLWCLAEADLLKERNSYRLTDTGQGLNRIQAAPSVSRAIHQVLHKSQQKLGSWVGSSVIHLGDHNVPNALMFIDKYTQVPRILNPLVLVLDHLPSLSKQEGLDQYIQECFGGAEHAMKEILTDFFRHAFDGSGADNFFDAGSCIDGRLTSAWNWCSKIEKKRYYPLFKLAGFVGFDGEFSK